MQYGSKISSKMSSFAKRKLIQICQLLNHLPMSDTWMSSNKQRMKECFGSLISTTLCDLITSLISIIWA